VTDFLKTAVESLLIFAAPLCGGWRWDVYIEETSMQVRCSVSDDQMAWSESKQRFKAL
jgi:hypothetical protein